MIRLRRPFTILGSLQKKRTFKFGIEEKLQKKYSTPRGEEWDKNVRVGYAIIGITLIYWLCHLISG